MYVTRSYLVEARSMRDVGITRGSVGQFDSCDIARRLPLGKDHGNLSGASVREITASERAQRKITGAEERPWILGSWQQEQSDINRARLASGFCAFQAGRSDRYDVEQPARLHSGPVKGKPAPKERPARIEKAVKAEKARAESDYQRMVREARSGLDMRNPRHVARYEARMARAQEAAQGKSSLNSYIAAERSCGRAV